jgi:GT2 family glycosyltransferase
MPSRSARPAFPRHLVTAVLVSHDGERWLRRSLAALEAQTRPAQRAVAVDTGSRDASLRILAAGLGASRIVHAERDTGFGAAIALGLEAYSGAPMPPNGPRAGDGAPVEWVWILHDDSAPDPDCLEALLRRAEDSPSAAVLGAKARGWDQSRLLLEVGLTTDGAGHRHTGLERREVDQGQHDDVRDVLAVGSAGMLVRRDVWDQLGGYDPRLSLFRDDLDFGWRANLAGHRVEVVTDAVIHHAQAAAAGHRRLAATRDFPRRVDRRNAMFTVLANASPLGLALGLPRLALATAMRALLFLLTRRPLLAIDELAAYLRLVSGTGALYAARRARASLVAVPRRSLRPLMAKPGARLRAIGEHIGDWLTAGRGSRALLVAPMAQALETGPSSDDDADLPTAGIAWQSVLLAPGLLLFAGLVVISLVAERHLLGRTGILSGGRLLPPPGGASDLWHTYLAGFHPVGVGSTSDPAPYLPVLALVSTVFLGKVWFAVDLLLLGCVPLAGLSAYAATRGYLQSRGVRAYAGAAYALLPVGVEAITAGRLGVAVAFVLLPLLVRALARCFIGATHRGGWRFAWYAGLLLSVAVAFAPDLLPAVALSIVAVALLSALRRPAHAVRFVLAALIVLVVPVLLLVPWTGRVWSQPGLLVLGTGRVVPVLDLPHARPSDLAFGWAGGVGVPAWWLTVGLLVAALSVLVRRDRVLTGLSAWALVAAGLIAGVVASHTTATSDGVPALGWPGAAAAVIGAGLVLAAALAADGALPRLAESSFGLRQPFAAAVVALALTAPLLATASWLSTGPPDDSALSRHTATVLPDFLAGNLAGSAGLRALVLRPSGVNVDYTVIHDSAGRTLDQAELVTSPAQRTRLDQLVQALSGGSGDAVNELATYDIGYIAVVSPTHDIALALETTVGLTRMPSITTTQVWKVPAAVGRLAIRPPAGDLSLPVVVPSSVDGAKAAVPAGAEGRTLVLADAARSGWRASLDGHPLTPIVVDGWAQGFVLPVTAGQLVLRYDSSRRDGWLALQLVVLMLVLVLAAPSVRTDDGPPLRPSDVPLDDVPLGEVPLDDVSLDDVPLDEVPLDEVPLDEVPLDEVAVDDVQAHQPDPDVPDLEDAAEPELEVLEVDAPEVEVAVAPPRPRAPRKRKPPASRADKAVAVPDAAVLDAIMPTAVAPVEQAALVDEAALVQEAPEPEPVPEAVPAAGPTPRTRRTRATRPPAMKAMEAVEVMEAMVEPAESAAEPVPEAVPAPTPRSRRPRAKRPPAVDAVIEPAEPAAEPPEEGSS